MLARYYNMEFENFKMSYISDADYGWYFLIFFINKIIINKINLINEIC